MPLLEQYRTQWYRLLIWTAVNNWKPPRQSSLALTFTGLFSLSYSTYAALTPSFWSMPLSVPTGPCHCLVSRIVLRVHATVCFHGSCHGSMPLSVFTDRATGPRHCLFPWFMPRVHATVCSHGSSHGSMPLSVPTDRATGPRHCLFLWFMPRVHATVCSHGSCHRFLR